LKESNRELENNLKELEAEIAKKENENQSLIQNIHELEQIN
jgi:sugar-specific transcriptional regulator TrmB